MFSICCLFIRFCNHSSRSRTERDQVVFAYFYRSTTWFTDVCMTGVSIIPPVIQTSVNFSIFNLQFLSCDITPEMLKLYRVTKVNVFFQVLVYVFNFDLFKFSAAILEKGLFSFFAPFFSFHTLPLILCMALLLHDFFVHDYFLNNFALHEFFLGKSYPSPTHGYF